MKFDDFRVKMEDVYDFNDAEDCHKMMTALLRDLEDAHAKIAELSLQLEVTGKSLRFLRKSVQ